MTSSSPASALPRSPPDAAAAAAAPAPARTRTILHVDMDAFFAAVELLDHPELAGKPLVIGTSTREHGVVAAASYAARKYGIRSAMPMARAEQLCPGLVRLRPRHRRYAEVARRVFALLGEYSPLVEPVSIDEAFLDVTGSARLHGDGPTIAGAIRRRVHAALGLTCSVGVAPNKFLAKVASDLRKPDGLVVVAPGEEAAFLAPLAVERLWGVGPQTARLLAELGIARIGELARFPPARLAAALGAERARGLQLLAAGRDEREVEPEGAAQSVSREETFADFLTAREDVERKLLELAEDVAARLRREGLAGRTVHLKVRDARYRTLTRALTLGAPTDLTATIHAAALRLWRERIVLGGEAVRLLGVGVSGLVARAALEAAAAAVSPAELPGQLLLFDEQGRPAEALAKQRRTELAVDAIRRRLGEGAIQRASLLGEGAADAAAGEEAATPDGNGLTPTAPR